MRTRNPGRFVLLHGFWIALVAAGIGCDNPAAPTPLPNQPNSQDGQTTPIAGLRSLAISGTLALHQPGDTGQLRVTATFTDGTTRDVTTAAAWSCNNCPPGVVSVSAGLVTAVGYGSGEIRAAYGGLRQSIAVRIAPEGAFLVKGPVTDGGPNFWLHDAKVEATSASGTYSTTTGTLGWFILPGAGPVTLRASKNGYEDAVAQVTVDHDQQVTLNLRRRQQPGTIIGVYTLVFTASPSCTLPPDAVRRTYTAQVEEGRNVGYVEDLVVMLNGANFEWDEAGFTGARDGTAVRFQITDEYEARLAVIELLGGMRMGYRGTATGVVSDKTIIATFDGRVRVSGGAAAECTAPDHRLEFTR
jgi:hypothetical protein